MTSRNAIPKSRIFFLLNSRTEHGNRALLRRIGNCRTPMAKHAAGRSVEVVRIDRLHHSHHFPGNILFRIVFGNKVHPNVTMRALHSESCGLIRHYRTDVSEVGQNLEVLGRSFSLNSRFFRPCRKGEDSDRDQKANSQYSDTFHVHPFSKLSPGDNRGLCDRIELIMTRVYPRTDKRITDLLLDVRKTNVTLNLGAGTLN